MNADTGRYARITHRLANSVASEDDEASQALALLLERRIIESIVVECAPRVTSDLRSERMTQAVTALTEQGVPLRLEGEGAVAEGCFCVSDSCTHAQTLLGRLLGVAVESIITREGRRALRPVGVFDPPGYTKRASMNASRLRS
jgi:hypothetical protein